MTHFLSRLARVLVDRNHFKSAIAHRLGLVDTSKKIHVENVFGRSIYQNNLDVVDYGSLSGFSIADFVRADPEFSAIHKNIRNGSVVADIGANIGLYTIAMAEVVGREGHVYSFEPGPISHALLLRNVWANDGLGDIVTVRHAAVSDREGPVKLYINLGGESDNQVHHNQDLDSLRNIQPEALRREAMVDAVTLDGFFVDGGRPLPDFLKVDTQGHEYHVLRGARKLFSLKDEINVTIEYAPYLPSWKKIDFDDFFALIDDLRLRIVDLGAAGGQTCSKDDLIKNYPKHSQGAMTTLLLTRTASTS